MVFPRCIIHALYVLGFIQELVCCVFRLLDLTHLVQCIAPASFSESSDHATQPELVFESASVSAILIKEMLPVVRFRDLRTSKGIVDDPCAICIGRFEGGDEIRALKNCEHVFHGRCLERWMECDRQTCPLCRAHLVPESTRKEFEEQLWAAEEALFHLHDEDWPAMASHPES
ncbi:hypothetical protein ACLOJK_032259 [Asimina triloba]